jgi:uncharacterized glyoxalase superfamily protein PhnB
MSHPTVFPALTYDDAQAAVDFLQRAFGAEQHALYRDDDGRVAHAEFRFGNGIVMFGGATPESPAARGGGGGVYITVEDPKALCERAREAGAEIVRDLHDTDYGSQEFSAKDPEGNAWHFGTYQPFAFDHEASDPQAAATSP